MDENNSCKKSCLAPNLVYRATTTREACEVERDQAEQKSRVEIEAKCVDSLLHAAGLHITCSRSGYDTFDKLGKLFPSCVPFFAMHPKLFSHRATTSGRMNMASPPCPGIPHGSDDDPLFHHYSAFPALKCSNSGDSTDFELEQIAARGPVLVHVATHSDAWGPNGFIRHMSSAYALDAREKNFCEMDPEAFRHDYAAV